MSIVEQINTDIKEAMKAKEKKKLEALRAIKSAILLIASEKAGSEVDDESAVTAMQKLVKQRKESAGIYDEQGRDEMAQEERFQASVIEGYLPEMMSEEEVRAAVQKQISQSGAAGPQDIGKVMGPLMGQLKGKADGKMISEIVKQELNKG